MKYLLLTIVFYFTLNTSIKAQDSDHKKELKEETVQHGAVGIGTTIVKRAKIGLGQERIAYIRAKYKEQKIAVKAAIKEGEATVVKAKEKLVVAKGRLEKDKVENRISERVYLARKERLELIEQKTKNLENTLNKN